MHVAFLWLMCHGVSCAGGGGKGGWGSFEDDIKDATKGDVHPNTNPKVDSKIQED
jgi:hypothetical protein